MAGTALAPRVATDWGPIREAYVTRTPIPTFTELSGEFSLSVSAVSRVANEEEWAGIRLQKRQDKMKQRGATEIILSALKGEEKLIQRARSTCDKVISAAELIVESITENAEAVKDSTRATSLNNVCFALSNLGRFVEALGIVG